MKIKNDSVRKKDWKKHEIHVHVHEEHEKKSDEKN